MRSLKVLMAACVSASLVFSAAGDSRVLFWNHEERDGDFSVAENWLVGDSEVAESAPVAADTVRFRQGGCTATSDRTVTLSADVTVSNFEYRTTSQTGRLTLDLNGKVLTVDSDLQLFTQGNGTAGDLLYVKDGTIRVIKNYAGTTTWGQPNEDKSGFFINRANAENGGIKAVFDNVTIDMVSKNQPVFNFNKLYGGEHFAIFTNGTTLVCSNMTISETPDTGSARIVFDGQGTKLMVDDGSSDADHSRLVVKISGNSEVEFRNGAELRAGCIVKSGDAPLILRGGNHLLRGINDYGNQHGLSAGGGMVAVTNGLDGESCSLAYGNNLRINNKGRLYVGPDCVVTSRSANIYFYIGKLESGTPTYGGVLEIDGGRVAAPWLRLGAQKAGSNSVVRIRGAHARLEQSQSQEWGTDKAMTVNYGCGLEFELPSDGFCNANGVARSPIYAAGCISTKTAAGVRPIYLKLQTKAFDKTHPKEALTLIQATAKTDRSGNDTSAFYATLLENVVWENAYHGELTVSDDGKRLLYTAPAKRGFAIILR